MRLRGSEVAGRGTLSVRWSAYETNVFLSRTNHVGSPWLNRSVVSGSARQIRRSVVSGSRATAASVTDRLAGVVAVGRGHHPAERAGERLRLVVAEVAGEVLGDA